MPRLRLGCLQQVLLYMRTCNVVRVLALVQVIRLPYPV
jgi:hypothetical protein